MFVHFTNATDNLREVFISEFTMTSRSLREYRCANKSLVRPTSRCILFDGENISFDASLVIYVVC